MAQEGAGKPGPAPPPAVADSSSTSAPAHAHIALVDGTAPAADEPHQATSPGLRNSKGWDGKLRMPKKATLANAEALSDPEYSDEDNVIPGEVIEADEDLLQDEDPETDEIYCTHSRVHSLAALRLGRFPRCQRLCLRQNGLQQIDDADADADDGTLAIARLADSLQELDLYDNLVRHMRGVEALPRLRSLDLSFNKIKHIKHLATLTELEELYLVANKISVVEGLDGLTKLRNLELGSNRIREIGTGLAGLVGLEELWLAKNKLTSLAGLAGLPRLRLLSIQSNRITSLAPLADVPTLEELYVSHNMLESLESLIPEEADQPADGADRPSSAATILPNLHILDIGNNQIRSLRGVEGLAQIQELWASYNQLTDFADVERALRDKTSLETVYLEGNPLQLRAPALYRNKVRLAVPQVQQIDATYVCE